MSSATVTAVIGPAKAVTAEAIADISGFGINTQKNILTVLRDSKAPIDFDIAAATTITVTKSSGVYTVEVQE